MTYPHRIPLQLLGQSGCRMQFPGATVYVDPYLSNSVQELDAPDLERLVPRPYPPEAVQDADWVLITHEHIDHCDPHTIPVLAQASPQAKFLAPAPVVRILQSWGIEESRTVEAPEADWLELASNLQVRAIPAAHPEIERDEHGSLAYVGYVIDIGGRRIYHAGDTSVRQEIIDVLQALGGIHTAFLPVNEHNFFRGRRGIIGNMSVREAFLFAEEIGARQVVAVHWDMFAANAVDPGEIRLIHRRIDPDFSLLLRPSALNVADAQISIVIRTLNEAEHLGDLLHAIEQQDTGGWTYEVILVDSGSTDGTLEIAERHGCRILHIQREEFSFGRALNLGCQAAQGEALVFISGHCIPTDEHWLRRLCRPILEGEAGYVYGRQFGGDSTYFSEKRIFGKYFPAQSCAVQQGCYCNNANSALRWDVWQRHRFDEDLTGLEDMHLAQRMQAEGGILTYVPDAGVYHLHDETWPQVRRRFEREAIALQKIMPQVHVNPADTLRYLASSISGDWRAAFGEKTWAKNALPIIRYRWNQYLGSFKGNHDHRKLSHAEKEKYFFPN